MNLPAEIEVEIHDGTPMVSSLIVSEQFEKQHSHVLRAIRNIIETELSDIVGLSKNGQSVFVEASYQNSQGKPQPMFWMTRDGFLALTMPFTGEKAARQRWKIIGLINRAEEAMRQVPAHDAVTLLEMVIKEHRQIISERDNLADAATAERANNRLLIEQRTKDFDRVREAERELSELKGAIAGAAKHLWKVHKEAESLGGGTNDIFSQIEAANVAKLPSVRQAKDWQKPL